MPHSWRVPVLLAALCLLAVPRSARAQSPSPREQRLLQEYLEMLAIAHEHYGMELSYRDLTFASIAAMMRILDPHTSFLTPESYDDMRTRQQESFYGIGILVSKRSSDLVVVSPIEGTPAFRLGLRSGDVIKTIDGETTNTMTLDEAVGKIKGRKGTEVRLRVVRSGLDEPLTFSIPRAEIPQETVRYAYMMTPEVGYLRLTDFSRSTSSEMEEALADLRGRGMKKLLLDLRSNGGGLLDQAVAVADQFLPAHSVIVTTRGRLESSHQEYLDDDEDPDPELAMPLVVLVNNGTASAAEILAGAIQDHDVGLIVGVPTWGKGLVQTVYNLNYRTGIALTTAKYYTPAGRLIQRDYASYYDYYSRFALDDEPLEEPGSRGPEFLTDLGRTVYGGGGITPDVLVELPDGPVILVPLFANNVFFRFAVDYQRRQPVASETWWPDDEVIAEFVLWLSDRDLLDEAVAKALADESALDFMRRQMQSDIFTAAFGTEAAHRALAVGDAQIQAGLDLLDQASDLLAQRAALGDDASRRQSDPAASGSASRDALALRASTPTPRTEYWPAQLQAADRLVQAQLLSDAGHFEEALRAFHESIELDGSDPYRRIELAKFRSYLAGISNSDEKRRENLEAAASEAAVARDLAPGDPEIARMFAQIHMRLGEHSRTAIDLAQQAYESLHDQGSADLQVLAALAQIYLWKNEPVRAVEVLREAQSYSPGNEMIEEMLAEALAKTDRVE